MMKYCILSEMLVAGYWLLVAGCWWLVTGGWLLYLYCGACYISVPWQLS